MGGCIMWQYDGRHSTFISFFLVLIGRSYFTVCAPHSEHGIWIRLIGCLAWQGNRSLENPLNQPDFYVDFRHYYYYRDLQPSITQLFSLLLQPQPREAFFVNLFLLNLFLVNFSKRSTHSVNRADRAYHHCVIQLMISFGVVALDITDLTSSF